jgi:hypothetical protein
MVKHSGGVVDAISPTYYLSSSSATSTYVPYSGATGNVTLGTNSISAGTVTVGTLGYSDTNILGSFQSSVNTYNQLIIQNTNSGSAASAYVVVNNNNSTASTYYGDLGMNSSGFTGSGAFNTPNMVYLTATTGDLALGTTTNNAIHFVVNGGTSDAMTISSGGTVSIGGLSSNGLVKTTSGTGALSIATAGTDYQVPLTFSTGLVNTSNTITVDQTFTPTWTGLQTFQGGVTLSGNRTLSAWGSTTAAGVTTGPGLVTASTSTFTDNTTASSGTVTYSGLNVLNGQAIAATNTSVSYTNVATLYIPSAPTAGTNVTITGGAYALYIPAGVPAFLGSFSGGLANGNFWLPTISNAAQTTTGSQYLFGGASTVNFRASIGGGSATTTIGASNSYGGVILASAPITMPSSGTTAWLANTVANSLGTVTNSTPITITNTASLYVAPAVTAGTNNFAIYAGGNIVSGGNATLNAFGSNTVTSIIPVGHGTQAATYTDNTSASSTTLTYNAANVFGIPTFAATNTSNTVTNSATVLIQGAPVAGTNETLTNKYSLYVVGGSSYFGGAINNVTVTNAASAATLTLVGGSTLQTTGAFTLNLTTTAATTPTFPTGAGTLAYIGGTNTWSGVNTYSGGIVMSSTTATQFMPSSTLAVSETLSQYLFGGASTIFMRAGFGSTTSTTLTTGVSSANFIVGSSPQTTFSSGTHAVIANAVVAPLGTITSGGATVTKTANLYVSAQTATIGTVNYGLYSAGVTGITSPIEYTTTNAVNATGTLTAAQVAAGTVTCTSTSAVTYTMPTATLLATQIGAGQGTRLTFTIDNSASTSSGAITITLGSGMTSGLTAGLTVPIGKAQTYEIYFTSATTCVMSQIL